MTFYVSDSGSDANAGTSPDSPWQTLAKVQSYPFVAGDEIRLNGGDSFADTLKTGSSGGPGNPITFSSYGSGQAHIGLGIYTNSNQWLTFRDLDVTNSPSRSSGVCVLLSGLGPSTNIVFDGLTVHDCGQTSSGGYGVLGGSGNNQITFENSRISNTQDSGFLFLGSGWTVTNNAISHTGLAATPAAHAIYAKGRDAVITNNTISDFQTVGISLRAEGAIVEGNSVDGASRGTKGIGYDEESSNQGTVTIAYNVVQGVSDYGIGSCSTSNVVQKLIIANNTIKTPAGTGIYAKGCSGATIRSLVIANNVVVATSTAQVYLNTASVTDTYLERNNVFSGGSGSAPFYWNGSPRSSLAAFQSVSGQGSFDHVADPQLSSALVPPAGSIAVDDGTTSIDASLSYVGDCSAQRFHFCGTFPDAGAVETGGTASAYRAAVLAGSPLVYWTLDDDGTAGVSSKAYDLSGNGHATTLSAAGVTLRATGALTGNAGSDQNAAARFTSTSSGSADAGDILDAQLLGTSAFTIESWVKPTSAALDKNRHYVVSKADTGSNYAVAVYVRNSGIGFIRQSAVSRATDSAFCAAFLPTTGFSHVVVTYDGAAMRIYLNGSLCATKPSTRSLPNSATTDALRIGRTYATATSSYFDGTIDEVAIYGSALDAGTILAHYRAR